MMSYGRFDIISTCDYYSLMARVAFTLRMDEEERAALEDLSRIEGRPVNQLLNDAVKSYLNRRSPEEQRLEASLERLRAYRKRDPGFGSAMAAFVQSEASLEDPVEGEPFEDSGTSHAAGTRPEQIKARVISGA
jgi:predicted transcriptional regulator